MYFDLEYQFVFENYEMKIPRTYLHKVQTARSFKTCLRSAEISAFICSTLVSSLVSSTTLEELWSGLKFGRKIINAYFAISIEARAKNLLGIRLTESVFF